MKEPKNGGPAFLYESGGPYKQEWSGISVRDYFASDAMQAIINKVHDLSRITPDQALAVAQSSYYIADAMLRVRDA